MSVKLYWLLVMTLFNSDILPTNTNIFPLQFLIAKKHQQCYKQTVCATSSCSYGNSDCITQL